MKKAELEKAIRKAWAAVDAAERAKAEVYELLEDIDIPDFKEQELLETVAESFLPLNVGGRIIGPDVSMEDILACCDETHAKMYWAFFRYWEKLGPAETLNEDFPGAKEAYDNACSYAEAHPDKVEEFEKYIDDSIITDREIAAFGFALDEVYGKEEQNG